MPAQAAIIFELRHFDRYYEFTRRLLEMLKKEWGADSRSPELVTEMDLTLKHIQ